MSVNVLNEVKLSSVTGYFKKKKKRQQHRRRRRRRFLFAVCDSLESGVGAVFGPAGPEASATVRSICASMEVPHVETNWRASAGGRAGYGYYVNVYPDPAELSRGYTAIVRDMDWTSFTLLYQRDEALLRLQHLIQDYSGSAKPSDADQSAVAIVKLPENRDFR